MNVVFHSFDYVYVVNLDADSQRMERVSARLRKLSVPFERFPARHPSSGQISFRDPRIKPGLYGCAESHAALLRLIRKREHENVLILEDDVVFRDDTVELMHQVAPELASEPWDIFYMGLHLIHSAGRVTKHLGRVEVGFHAHAYAVSRNAVPRLLECIERMLANPVRTFDSYEDGSLVKLYAIPILAVQEPNQSYTFQRYIDRLPQYFSEFDGNDFEAHCTEMQHWKTNWRKVVAFSRELAAAKSLFATGDLNCAVNSFKKTLTEWPEFEQELRSEPGFRDVMNAFDRTCAADKDLIRACRWLSNAIKSGLARHF